MAICSLIAEKAMMKIAAAADIGMSMAMDMDMVMCIITIITAMAASARRTRRTNARRRSKLPLKGVCFVFNDREQVGERGKDTTLGKSARSFLTNGTNTDNIPIRVKFLWRSAHWGVV